jgi:hypothetical protein
MLRLYTDRLAAGASSAPTHETNRVVYVAEGLAVCRGSGIAAHLATHGVWQGRAGVTVTAGPRGCRLLRWELSSGPPGLLAGDGVASTLTLAAEPRIEPGQAYLMRCDRVDFPPGGIAYTHTHRGSGIRCLQQGRIRVETEGRDFWVEPGEAWFETGSDEVYAQTWGEGPSHFIRVMILPASIRGKSSLRYVKPEDLDKPKPQTYQVFTDEAIELF